MPKSHWFSIRGSFYPWYWIMELVKSSEFGRPKIGWRTLMDDETSARIWWLDWRLGAGLFIVRNDAITLERFSFIFPQGGWWAMMNSHRLSIDTFLFKRILSDDIRFNCWCCQLSVVVKKHIKFCFDVFLVVYVITLSHMWYVHEWLLMHLWLKKKVFTYWDSFIVHVAHCI